MQIRMVVTGLTIDSTDNTPLVLLRDDKHGRTLSIGIGVIEASTIAFELENVHITRPTTHDLLKATIATLGGKLERITITDWRDNLFYAALRLSHDGQVTEVDARPSDAIALAVRAGAPVYCDARVLARVPKPAPLTAAPLAEMAPPVQLGAHDDKAYEKPKPIVRSSADSMHELLESLTPADFGKYKM